MRVCFYEYYILHSGTNPQKYQTLVPTKIVTLHARLVYVYMMLYIHVHSSYMTLIRGHEMHGQMPPN